ncbi:MAG: aminotransferase class IV family protein [Acidobacteriia bacterium]|nr:aminotransferase class IV family protein [Terriglobia bacterium]
MHGFLLHNGSLHKTSEKLLSPGQVGLMNGWGVFSTMRVFDGVLFAFERHWARMKKDATLMRVPFPDSPEALHDDLLKLVAANHTPNATLRVCIVRNRGGLFEGEGNTRDFDCIAFTTDIHRWGKDVTLAVQPHARHAACAFAGAKILSWAFNLTWLEMARERGFDEVILLNEHGRVSECTSANIFAAIGSDVRTPPLSSGCLPGVTREILLSESRAAGIVVAETGLGLEDLYNADSVFITSTTRELLPVRSIEGRELRQDGPARLLMQKAFSKYVDRYVSEARSRVAVG